MCEYVLSVLSGCPSKRTNLFSFSDIIVADLEPYDVEFELKILNESSRFSKSTISSPYIADITAFLGKSETLTLSCGEYTLSEPCISHPIRLEILP